MALLEAELKLNKRIEDDKTMPLNRGFEFWVEASCRRAHSIVRILALSSCEELFQTEKFLSSRKLLSGIDGGKTAKNYFLHVAVITSCC